MNKKLKNKLKKKIRVIPNFPKKGIQFQDITSITDSKPLFTEVVNEISKYCKKNKFTKVAGIEARGFIFGSAVAYKLGLPFIPIRKKGKLPGKIVKQKYKLEYGENSLSIQKNALQDFKTFAIVDDLLATGGTIASVSKILDSQKKEILGASVVVELSELKARKILNFEIVSEIIY